MFLGVEMIIERYSAGKCARTFMFMLNSCSCSMRKEHEVNPNPYLRKTSTSDTCIELYMYTLVFSVPCSSCSCLH